MKARHTIKAVSTRTGLSPHVIRIWERRYGAVDPERTDTNRRLYSDGDVERLILLRKATLAGESIGQIANLSTEELAGMVNGIRSVSTPMDEPLSTETEEDYVERAVKAVTNFDAEMLERILLQASVALGQPRLIDGVIQPLLIAVGDRWQRGEIKVAHEHLASAVIRTVLGNLLSQSAPDDNAPILLATTLSGQMHELGALMAAATAASAGWNVMYLGPNMPAEDIASAARRRETRAVVISLVYPDDDPRVTNELSRLRRLLDPRIELLVGGRASESYKNIIEQNGGVHITGLEHLFEKLASLRSRSEAG